MLREVAGVVESGDSGAELGKGFAGNNIAEEAGVVGEAFGIPVPEGGVVGDEIWGDGGGFVVELEDEAVGGEVGIHPGHGVGFFDIEGALFVGGGMRDNGGAGGSGGFGGLGFGDLLVVVEDLSAEEGVDFHDTGDTLYLNAAAFGGEIGSGLDTAGLDVAYIVLEG